MWMIDGDLIRRTEEEKILRKDSRGNWVETGTRIVPTGIPIARVIKKEQVTLIAAAPELLEALELAFNSGFLPEGGDPYESARAAINKAKGV